MREILTPVGDWLRAGQPVALATVVSTWGSSPRQPGAKMAVAAGGEIAGSVSGGCVEGAVVEAAFEVIRSGRPQLLHFGVADEDAWEVGLACGGEIEVFVQPLGVEWFAEAARQAAQSRPYALLTCIAGPEGSAGAGALLTGSEVLLVFNGGPHPKALVRAGSGRSTLFEIEGQRYFLDEQQPSPELVIVGGVHISIPLVTIAGSLGYETTVIEPRRAFGSAERFAHAGRLIQAWPDEGLAQVRLGPQTAVAVLTHDPKLDDPALLAALRSDAFYVGALGSRSTQEKRRARLQAAGLTAAQLARLHGPIGLDLGGRSPEEIALAIMAEIVKVRNLKSA